mmetsp:Transcript_20142/g.47040  ORF Transcript_20142/g.47040 Transcript_20142/m.47040 type:complete len:285 (+) Transcript_20142:3222-4076(+)
MLTAIGRCCRSTNPPRASSPPRPPPWVSSPCTRRCAGQQQQATRGVLRWLSRPTRSGTSGTRLSSRSRKGSLKTTGPRCGPQTRALRTQLLTAQRRWYRPSALASKSSIPPVAPLQTAVGRPTTLSHSRARSRSSPSLRLGTCSCTSPSSSWRSPSTATVSTTTSRYMTVPPRALHSWASTAALWRTTRRCVRAARAPRCSTSTGRRRPCCLCLLPTTAEPTLALLPRGCRLRWRRKPTWKWSRRLAQLRFPVSLTTTSGLPSTRWAPLPGLTSGCNVSSRAFE